MRSGSKLILFGVLIFIVGCGGSGGDAETTAAPAETAPAEEAHAEARPDPEEQVAGLDAMCAEAAPAIAARQTESSLYDRVGGRDGVHAVVADAMARHYENDDIAYLMEGVDTESVIGHVTDYMVIGAGGGDEYNGREIVGLHAGMELGNREFMAAGADFIEAMTAAGWGEGEQQEVLCMFASLRSQVVTR